MTTTYKVCYEGSRIKYDPIFTNFEEAKAEAIKIYKTGLYEWVQVRSMIDGEDTDKDYEFEIATKIYIKKGQQLGLPNEKFYEVPYDASDEMLLDIQRWWEGKD